MKSSFLLLIASLAAMGSAAAQTDHSASAPLRLYIVTGGHDYHTSFYRLFDDTAFQFNLRPQPGRFRGRSLIAALAWGGGTISHEPLQRRLEALAGGADGRLGVCVEDAAGRSCLRGNERFPMQSVMKLVVAVAAMEAVDHKSWRLDEPVLVRRQDLSLFVQPLAKLVTDRGYRTTIGDLVRRAVVDSDSAAADILIARLGGTKAVQPSLDGLGVTGVRIDRDERHLQTEIVGLSWRPEYLDPKALDLAIAGVPRARREAANRAYRVDVRDTATPRGMTELLERLATQKLLSERSTRYLMNVMRQTVTFPERLKAGAAPGWTLGHKTGTGGTWNGVTPATNDVGIFHPPMEGLFQWPFSSPIAERQRARGQP
jgi:beta-lactamase class A